MTDETPPIENYDRWLQALTEDFGDDSEPLHNALKCEAEVRALVEESRTPYWILASNHNWPVLVKKPSPDDHRKFLKDLELAGATNKPRAVQMDEEHSIRVNYALKHIVYPARDKVTDLAANDNYDLFEHACALLLRIARGDGRINVLKLVRSSKALGPTP
jgi:hypothetical protein